MRTFSKEAGFTISELLVSTTIMLFVAGAALGTFKSALDINDAAGLMADSNQNLRSGANLLVRDLMMAGRVIAGTGVPAPWGSGAQPIRRPLPPGTGGVKNYGDFTQYADPDGSMNIPSITPGYGLGPTLQGLPTDIITLLTVDEFMPVVTTPVPVVTAPTAALQGYIAKDASSVTLSASSPWLVGDTTNDTVPIQVGDLILFKNSNGMSIQTVTSLDTTHLYFAQSDATHDPFRFNQRGTGYKGTIWCIKNDPADSTVLGCNTVPISSGVQGSEFPVTALFRLVMTTYYVDSVTTPGTPRLTRLLNDGAPQALAGVVEDLDFSFDLVDATGSSGATGITNLPYTTSINGTSVTFNSSMIKKVNIHVGVRSETIAKPSQDFVRNHVNTSVVVRSLASVDRYDTDK